MTGATTIFGNLRKKIQYPAIISCITFLETSAKIYHMDAITTVNLHPLGELINGSYLLRSQDQATTRLTEDATWEGTRVEGPIDVVGELWGRKKGGKLESESGVYRCERDLRDCFVGIVEWSFDGNHPQDDAKGCGSWFNCIQKLSGLPLYLWKMKSSPYSCCSLSHVFFLFFMSVLDGGSVSMCFRSQRHHFGG